MSRLNNNPNKNKNYYRVEKKIINAFLTLLENRNIDDINIKEICDIANVNRTTFYDHYANIDSLFNKIYNETYSYIVSIIPDEDTLKVIFNNPNIELPNRIKLISPYGRKLINYIFKSNKNIDITNKVVGYLTKLIVDKYNINAKETKIKTVLLGTLTQVIYSLLNKNDIYVEILSTSKEILNNIVNQ